MEISVDLLNSTPEQVVERCRGNEKKLLEFITHNMDDIRSKWVTSLDGALNQDEFKNRYTKLMQQLKKLSQIDNFSTLLLKSRMQDEAPEAKLVLKGQYKEAFELLEDAEACQLF